MTTDPTIAATKAVLNSAANDPDGFWDLIGVPFTTEPFPPEVESWNPAGKVEIGSHRYYPRGVLAHFALGNVIRACGARGEGYPEEPGVEEHAA